MNKATRFDVGSTAQAQKAAATLAIFDSNLPGSFRPDEEMRRSDGFHSPDLTPDGLSLPDWRQASFQSSTSVSEDRFPKPIHMRSAAPLDGEQPRVLLLDSLQRSLFTESGLRFDSTLKQYHAAFVRCFKNPNEVEDLNTLKCLLNARDGDFDIHVVLDSTLDTFVAGYQTKLAELSSLGDMKVSVGEYLWVAPEMRGSGLSFSLYRETLRLRSQQGAHIHVGEVKIPSVCDGVKHNSEQEKKALERAVEFWGKQSRMAFDAPWIQPPLSPGKRELDYLRLTFESLGTKPIDFERGISPDVYLEIWRKLYPDHVHSWTYTRLVSMVQGWKNIPIRSLAEWKDFDRYDSAPYT